MDRWLYIMMANLRLLASFRGVSDAVEQDTQESIHAYHDTCHGFALIWMAVFAMVSRTHDLHRQKNKMEIPFKKK